MITVGNRREDFFHYAAPAQPARDGAQAPRSERAPSPPGPDGAGRPQPILSLAQRLRRSGKLEPRPQRRFEVPVDVDPASRPYFTAQKGDVSHPRYRAGIAGGVQVCTPARSSWVRRRCRVESTGWWSIGRPISVRLAWSSKASKRNEDCDEKVPALRHCRPPGVPGHQARRGHQRRRHHHGQYDVDASRKSLHHDFQSHGGGRRHFDDQTRRDRPSRLRPDPQRLRHALGGRLLEQADRLQVQPGDAGARHLGADLLSTRLERIEPPRTPRCCTAALPSTAPWSRKRFAFLRPPDDLELLDGRHLPDRIVGEPDSVDVDPVQQPGLRPDVANSAA
jgi:hypothetical protein